MMQSARLVQAVSTKLNMMLLATPRPICCFSSSSGGDNDDAMTQGVDTQGETKPDDDEDNVIPTREDDHYIHLKTVTSNLSSSKLQTPGVNTPLDPHVQQKRAKSTKSDNKEHELTLCCAGLDGSPWPDDKGSSKEEDVEEGEDDNKEYFKHHKASPLFDIEIVDSRKPLTQVMHGTAGGFGDEKVMKWTPEQLDTAENSLRRATEMFQEAAARGVPDWPHSRRLRQLLGEQSDGDGWPTKIN